MPGALAQVEACVNPGTEAALVVVVVVVGTSADRLPTMAAGLEQERISSALHLGHCAPLC